MIKYLDIQNFQSHEHSRLEFVPGLNVIQGISLNGKTAIARALNLIINNRPMGAKYYSNFAPDKGSTIIEIGLDDSKPIKLEKQIKRKPDGKKIVEKTIYAIADEEVEFTGSAKNDKGREDVPDVIKQAFNFTELNMQRQFEAPFLILSSSGEIARAINRITKQEKVDEWVSEFTRRINRKRNEVELLETQVKEIEIELAGYIGFESLESDVKSLEIISSEIEKLDNDFKSIDDILIKIEDIDDSLKEIIPALSLEADIEKIKQLEADIEGLSNKRRLISKILFLSNEVSNLEKLYIDIKDVIDYQYLIQEKSELSVIINHIENVDLAIKNQFLLINDIDRLIEIGNIEKEFSKINNLVFVVEKIEDDISSLSKNLNEAKKQYVNKLKEIGKCPTCFIDIDDKTIKKVIREI